MPRMAPPYSLCTITTFANPIVIMLIQHPIESAPQEVVTEETRGSGVHDWGNASLYHIDQATCFFFRALYDHFLHCSSV